MAGPSLQPWQWGVLALSYILFFIIPATRMWKRAKKDGDNPFVWTMLVLVGSFMGFYEYFHHRGILKARAKRAARRAEAAKEGGGAGAEVDANTQEGSPEVASDEADGDEFPARKR